ncbi:MAG: type I restriction endonuclease subunit R [Chitinophaga sp.]|uniref:type I restriction endonuclease subunit R n=1 Tax=Chitinophaga sp. TaxID=1869181 RepID=UPI0025BACEA3|nr:type I restriction endonuclease [Chitinophaga sp.]MBV8252420.1 type I restriction endonuclease subunit R [Chitinophaga sp.]
MPSETNEQALESTIEKGLTGSCLEELHGKVKVNDSQFDEREAVYSGGNGYQIGFPADFNIKYAIDEVKFWDFLESTQEDELTKLKKQSDWKLKILERLDRMIKKYGILRLLRKGLEVDDAHFTLFFVPPVASSSQKVKDNFEKNRFSVTRQLRYSLANPGEEIDMVIFINGLPIVTMELKNPWTGQNAKVHGQEQYKFKRDVNQPLLNFGRCIVHFTLDTDEAYMTTKLDGANTFFLPFNLGHNFGKGNPPNPFGHKTAYIWQEVFTKLSLANIIQHFVRFDGKDTDPLSKKNLFFPRYHQLDVVRRLVADAGRKGVGQSYLIQHSAGSGKSNSITWTAYQLIEIYPENEQVPGARGISNPLFDSVIVVTDRRLLDKQLRENIKEFSEVKNIVAPAYTSKELKSSLESGKRIIITTIQKFPFILDGMADMSEKRFAVIIDEAHSSQSGTASDSMNKAMGGGNGAEEDEEDPQDKILAAMQARKMRGNASYFAFTATPKKETLEKFGQKQEDGKYKPFHLYSMKQAIEEGFILDVLANYTTYRSYYEIEKSIAENPMFDSVKAQKKLKAYVEGHRQTIAVKAEIMLDHFLTHVVNTKKLKGKAKGMVVSQRIESAIHYYFALKALLKEKGNPFKIAIAFSGKKIVDGVEHTEDSLNGFPEKDTRDKFAEDAYRLLVVANKYLTGFDQPKLTAMYVDKKLQGVLAVQALSRLNRSANKLGKRTEDLFILDFFNSTEDIKAAFDPFYTATTLSKATDVNVLHDLKAHLDDVGVYEWLEVELFNEKYFKKGNEQLLNPIIDVPADRFNNQLDLDDQQKADFKIKAKQFVKIYGQMASILPYEVVKWEKLFWFLKFLIPKLIITDPSLDKLDEILNTVDLSTYGLERIKLNENIGLDATETELDPQNSNPRGAFGNDHDKDPLDVIILNFNQRWFQGWEATQEEQRVKFVHLAESIKAHPDFKKNYADNPDKQNRNLAFDKIFGEVMHKQKKSELDLYRLISNDEAFKLAMQDTLKRILNI